MLDPFYPVVPDAGWVAKLVPVGTKLIQLRIKEQPDAEVRRQVREARTVCAAHGAQLIVNDYWQVAIDEDCAWVHLGQEDLVDADADTGAASARTIMPSSTRAWRSIPTTWRWGRSTRPS